MTKIIAWNLNGIRAVAKKGLVDILHKLNAEIYCFQETKAQDDQVVQALEGLKDYHIYSNSAEKKGYSGVAILTKQKPLSINKGIGIDEHDKEGRVITAEYDEFYLVNVYVPNSQGGLVRLPYRQKWDNDFRNYILSLEATKPVIVCGDMNVAHRPIDIKNDKANFNKTAGYTVEEIEGMDKLIEAGYIDAFRYFYPNEEKYSWWSYRMKARERNIGWRIDYFLVSEKLEKRLEDAFILNEIHGSDHCPVGIKIGL